MGPVELEVVGGRGVGDLLGDVEDGGDATVAEGGPIAGVVL